MKLMIQTQQRAAGKFPGLPFAVRTRVEEKRLQSSNRQIIEWVDRAVVQADFVMAVRRGRTSCAANGSDLFAACDVLADFDINARHVAISSCDAVPVVNDDYVAVSAKHSSEDNDSISRGLNRSAVIGGDVQTAVRFAAAAAKRITAPAKSIGYVSAHWPAARRRRKSDLIFIENVFDLAQFAFQRSRHSFHVVDAGIGIRSALANVGADVRLAANA